jgi:hypothetical protein
MPHLFIRKGENHNYLERKDQGDYTMDISNANIKIQCPNCSFEIDVLLKQVVAEELILCPGCTKEIKLLDETGSVSRAQAEIDNAIEEFGRQLNRRM